MPSPLSHFLAGKKIIVAGSGIAGLSFVAAIHKLWDPSQTPPKIVTYDRDTKDVSVQREGYTISISGFDKDGGLVALRDLGLLDQILGKAVLGMKQGHGFVIWDTKFGRILSLRQKPYGGLPTAGIRLHRRDLRTILIEACEQSGSTINWGVACLSAEPLENGRTLVYLSGPKGNYTDDCDILIAADGASSKIRTSLRPEDKLQFAGVRQVGGVARFPEGNPEPFIDNWGLLLTGQGVSCFFSPVDSTGVLWSLSCLDSDPRPQYDQSEESFAKLKKEALEIGHMVPEPFQTVVKNTERETSIILPARDKPPFSHKDVTPGVFFIGDSNHAVSPFAGNGANMALKDGWDLATQLCTQNSLEDAAVAYDKIAVPRAEYTLKTSRDRIAYAHNTGIKYYAFRVGLWMGGWLLWLSGKS